MKVRIAFLYVSFYVAFMAASAALAQQVEIVKNPVTDSYTAVINGAVVNGEKGESRYMVIKDPGSPFLVSDERFKGNWKELTQLGNLPWGKPAKTFDEIRKDPAVRGHIDTDTSLSPEQKSALYKALDDSNLSVATINADQLPVLAVFWGNGWFHNKVSFNFEAKFRKTKVYLFFVAETNDWYTFHAYCRNLGQPAVGFAFQAHVDEVVVTPPLPVVVPRVEPPSCVKLERTDNKLSVIQVGQTAQLAASFNNPSGIDFAFRYVAINKVTGEKSLIAGFGPTASITTNDAVNYRIYVEGEYEGKPIQASACVLELSFFNPPPARREPPPEKAAPPSSKKWIYVVVAVVAVGAVGFLATHHGGTSSPTSTPTLSKPGVCVPNSIGADGKPVPCQ